MALNDPTEALPLPPPPAVPRLVIAGAHSGAGKTTLTAGLIAALRRRRLVVQPFKAGPDYIDPSYHTLAAGRACRNLDTWMLPPAAVRSAFARGCRGADLAVVEGVMGLYDGFSYDDETGSTAHLARLLDAPVVLVLNIASMARSAAAVALGYREFDRALRLAGFILNHAGSPAHGAGVAASVTAATGLPCFGWLPRSEHLGIPERHLGLVPTAEPGRWEAFLAAAADHVAMHLDLDALLAVAQAAGRPSALPDGGAAGVEGAHSHDRVRIAVARDEAFSFYYEDNLELLAAAGAEIVFFSPLRASALPAGCRGLYIGGGFPEMYAARLAENAALRTDLRLAIGAGLPTYAECGGLMYLTQAVTDLSGATYPMVGVLRGASVMSGRLTLGYRQVVTLVDTLLAPAGVTLRGHEFHYSEWMDRPAAQAAYRVVNGANDQVRLEGFASPTLLASYIHLHWAALPHLAARFVEACRDKKHLAG
ncbi:MAG: cobyrinate a,c-diamide synthase [Chloroflexi bacterium HGW-Chloroflexi-1]|nr:MAG: cobyrinate a,c-diamide synthase [Chloroflexi bacterium HGW-Chloroflexi-1]